MAKSAWPTGSELTTYLSGLGVSAYPSGFVAAEVIESAVTQIETRLGYQWLPDASDTDYTYNAPQTAFLDLGAYFTTITSVADGAGVDDVDGTTLTAGVDYYTSDPTAPYDSLFFIRRIIGNPHSVIVTGKKGRSASIPQDLWQAALNIASYEVIQALVQAGTESAGDVQKIKQGPVEYTYGTSEGPNGIKGLLETANKAIKRYKRILV